jgi:hypothetical protein
MNRRRLFPWLPLAVFVLMDNGQAAHAQNGGRDHLKDNSFLIEEAYNQEAGVVQHIFSWYPTWDHSGGDRQDFTFQYVIELPLGGERHQLSFNPLVFEHFSDRPDGGPSAEEGGWGDTLLNYRYQLTMDDECGMTPAISPRFSLILPTGDEDRGLGTGEVGYQFNLPVSKELDLFAFHFNAGLTYTPGVSAGPGLAGRDLNGYNLGASAIWLATYDFNVMLEFLTLWDEEFDDQGNLDRTTSVILDPGVRFALFTGEEVQWVGGVGIPIGLSADAFDYGVFVYMSVEHIFRTVE